MDLKNKRVTVMGLGLHGGAVGTIAWLVRQGASVLATDLKTEAELAPSLERLRKELGRKFKNVQFVLGVHREEDFRLTDMVVRNPAVPRKSKYLQIAHEAGIPIEMDSSLFFAACAALGATDIIGITGSKGKTTCTKVLAALLQAEDEEAHLVEVGTDGVSPLAELKHITPETTVVFELSSWRLEALAERKISPPVAVITSLYRDHLNTYESFEEYIETKQTIFRFQKKNGQVVLNADDAQLRAHDLETPGKRFWFSMRELPADAEGIFVRDGAVVIRLEGAESVLFPVHSIALPHEHERRNVLPGILLAYLREVRLKDIARGVRALERLPHRLETVREVQEVRYINDSAATMPDATIAALRSLAGERIVHILGGGDKALQFEELANAEAASVIRALIWLPGTATANMRAALKQAFGDAAPPAYEVATMPEAVQRATELAQPGDVVLLSPGATSFGLFLHEFDRGEQFRAAVDPL